jgi:hypothetical protein
MAYFFPDLVVSLDFNLALKNMPANTLPVQLGLHGSTTISSRGNCYPDHLFQSALRLLYRIAPREAPTGPQPPTLQQKPPTAEIPEAAN